MSNRGIVWILAGIRPVLGDPLGNAYRRVERSVGVDLDHHLQPRLDDFSGNLRVGGVLEAAFVNCGGNGGRLTRDVSDMLFRAAKKKTWRAPAECLPQQVAGPSRTLSATRSPPRQGGSGKCNDCTAWVR